MGVSRAAVLVASYLMIFQHMSVMEALGAVRKKRAVNPNEGFLKQLRALNEALMEERDDDDDTLSQCSVVDAHARARIFGEEEEEEEEERSMVGVKAHSIVMEEEEDGQSVMSSVASSAFGSTADDRRPAPREVALPETGGGGGGGEEEEEEEEEEDGLDSMIREWQRRSEKYQDDGWWEAQLDSDGEDGERGGEEAQSVTSEEVRSVKERLRRRVRRPASDAGSSSSSMSYSDLWKRRLKEIEEQAAARCRRQEDGDGGEGAGTEGGRRKIDEEVQSLLSDSGSMYNFCHKNKEKMTPLERWRVKRIQFGWNKKDREDEGGADGGGGAETPAYRDVNLTAYQTWKLRQQRRLGEENPEELVAMSRGEDSAAARRRQRREEILERSKKTLQESQSMSGWEAESAVSGATVPLSAFWAGAGVTGTPSGANDDAASVLSGRSSVFSSVSQPRGARPLPPVLPVPTVPGPGGEPMVDLASIQNWIADVVSQTIRQKQTEMSLPPPSSAGSEFRFGGAGSVASGRGAEDDKASVWSAASYSRGRGGAASVLSGAGGSGVSGLSGRSRITTTSVALCSLFQDQVDLGRLDAMDRDMKAEMRGKMAAYEKKKILEDNRRSTMYKKKKPQDDEDEEEREERKRKEEDFLAEATKEKKPARSFGLSGCLNLSPALERERNTSVDEWLTSVRPPPRRMAAAAIGQEDDPYDDLDASASEFDSSSRRASYAPDEDEDALAVPSGFGARDARGGPAAPLGYGRPHAAYAEAGVAGGRRGGREGGGKTQEEEEEDDVTAFIAQTRQRARARAAAEADDHEVLEAWRAQQDARAHGGAPRGGRTDGHAQ
ncbi:Inactive dual specificity phosphatase 27 [Liparis tanakae]|uniref:Inactive dual specificity phosphatase 27 n=1 Tax=Liparis tanakae TaxID=230148 RepID=A0A4Z2I7C0_9TELE|nr:Inactive dual specificity phosphatase 27 [Liparis tanakae]